MIPCSAKCYRTFGNSVHNLKDQHDNRLPFQRKSKLKQTSRLLGKSSVVTVVRSEDFRWRKYIINLPFSLYSLTPQNSTSCQSSTSPALMQKVVSSSCKLRYNAELSIDLLPHQTFLIQQADKFKFVDALMKQKTKNAPFEFHFF